jgi:plastocyanin
MSAQTATVDIIEFKFVPQEITVKVGDSVRWTNREKRQYHSVWFEKLGEPEPDYLFPDDSYQRRFDQAGNFPYRCGPHPEMTGVVHVQ